MENTVTIPRWFDRHLHGREGEKLRLVLPKTINQLVTGALFMPNLTEPITTIERAVSYLREIGLLINRSDFQICLAFYLTDDSSPEVVVEGFKRGLWKAVKLYMANRKGHGGTTGSSHGVRDLVGRYPVFSAMEKHGIPLLGHFEAVEEDVDEFDREVVSMERDLFPVLKAFPDLQVVFEHLTDGRCASFVAGTESLVYATVTPHHLMINRNAMFMWDGKTGMNPAHYCKPVPKREEHRKAVRRHVTSGNPRFGAGTDSAPHYENVKAVCYGCAAGIFNAPAALEMYTTVFDQDEALDHLGNFLSVNFLNLYGMEVSKGTITLERGHTVVPRNVGDVPVFMGGKILPWRISF